eukprot:PLAT11580.1.p1 GENE.PLAT11580.1~~PLAT11580.1.p1  ORF type:complete len:1163 (+),score=689.78 PLAT11580.1:82-3570(+)
MARVMYLPAGVAAQLSQMGLISVMGGGLGGLGGGLMERGPGPRDFGYPSFDDKGESGFVGLTNQGATCYMNSLLQTLFMTPEFRAAVYEWKYDEKEDGPREECIPLQLQRLFAHMQLSDRPSLETKELTASFGWTAADAFQQHDVSELNRVLIDALEDAFKGTDMEDLLSKLYEAKMVDYVHCRDCDTSREREDKYYDVPLVIKDQFSGVHNDSVAKGLDSFCTSELLEGDNQYFCEKCDKKCDADKGLKFKTLPYILTLHLKRFDFNFMTMERVKVNDEMSFPYKLNMDKWMGLEPPAEGADSGVYDYELFSILIHAGGAMGGHYYSYIRNFETDTWFKFDDETVSELEAGAIEAAFGEKEEDDEDEDEDEDEEAGGSATGGASGIEELDDDDDSSSTAAAKGKESPKKKGKKKKPTASAAGRGGLLSLLTSLFSGAKGSANAYMLCYRRVAEDNTAGVGADAVPADAAAEVEADNARFVAAKEEYNAKKRQITLKVTYPYPELDQSAELETSTAKTLAEVTAEAAAALGVEDVPAERMRLRRFTRREHMPGKTYDGKDDSTLEELDFAGFGSTVELMLETIEEGKEFIPYDPNSMVLKLKMMDSETGRWSEPKPVSLNYNATLAELRVMVEAEFGLPADKQRLWDLTTRMPMIMEGDDRRLYADFRLSPGEEVHIELEEGEPSDSRVLREFEMKLNAIIVMFNKPGSMDMDNALRVDKRKPLRNMKQAIANACGLDINDFRIMRGDRPSIRFKDLDKSIEECGIRHSSLIYCQLGTPLMPGHYEVNFHIVELNEDTGRFRFHSPWSAVVDGEATIASIKADAFDFLQKRNEALRAQKSMAEPGDAVKTAYGEGELLEVRDDGAAVVRLPFGIAYLHDLNLKLQRDIVADVVEVESVDHLRLRDRSRGSESGDPSRLCHDGQTLKTAVHQLLDGRDLCLQVLPEAERLADDALLVRPCLWQPTEQQVVGHHELVVRKKTSLAMLKPLLAERWGVPEEHLLIVKLAAYHTPDADLCPNILWERAVPMLDTELAMPPWHTRDGDRIICKDARDAEVEVIEELDDSVGADLSAYAAATGMSYTVSGGVSTGSPIRRAPRERALKIRKRSERHSSKEEEAAGDEAEEVAHSGIEMLDDSDAAVVREALGVDDLDGVEIDISEEVE